MSTRATTRWGLAVLGRSVLNLLSKAGVYDEALSSFFRNVGTRYASVCLQLQCTILARCIRFPDHGVGIRDGHYCLQLFYNHFCRCVGQSAYV